MFTIVIPVYRNEESVSDLIAFLAEFRGTLSRELEVVFVDDGSPDRSRELIIDGIQRVGLKARVILLSRNYGSLAAARAGLAAGSGDYFAVMAADLQEPPSLIADFFRTLEAGGTDIVIGTRDKRDDPLASRCASWIFWRVYRSVVQREVPPGGVDVFGCTRRFRDHLLALPEHNSTLVGLVFWLGFRRSDVKYARQARRHGKSAWSWSRKFRYLLDSAFAFSDLPIRMLSLAGVSGMVFAVVLATAVLITRLTGNIPVPGYTATVLTVMFFGGMNSFGIGLLGEYLWRTFENTKGRPEYLERLRIEFDNGRRIGDTGEGES